MERLHFWHRCIACQKQHPADRFHYTCPSCGGLLLVQRDEDYVKKVVGTGKTAQKHFDNLRFGQDRKKYPNDSGVWLWRDFLLPGFPESEIVALKEGQTDLFEVPGWLKDELGFKNLFINTSLLKLLIQPPSIPSPFFTPPFYFRFFKFASLGLKQLTLLSLSKGIMTSLLPSLSEGGY